MIRTNAMRLWAPAATILLAGLVWSLPQPADAQCRNCGSRARSSLTCRGKACSDVISDGSAMTGIGSSPADAYPAQRCGHRAPPYPVPYRTPTHVGYTVFTYPPMMPHNSLHHYRNIYSYRHAPGLSRTNVWWHPALAENALSRLHHIIELPR